MSLDWMGSDDKTNALRKTLSIRETDSLPVTRPLQNRT